MSEVEENALSHAGKSSPPHNRRSFFFGVHPAERRRLKVLGVACNTTPFSAPPRFGSSKCCFKRIPFWLTLKSTSSRTTLTFKLMINGRKTSKSAMSKQIVVWAIQRILCVWPSLVRSLVSSISLNEPRTFAKFLRETMTPLGVPVLPLVYMMYAVIAVAISASSTCSGTDSQLTRAPFASITRFRQPTRSFSDIWGLDINDIITLASESSKMKSKRLRG